jgi:competence protein ComEA
MRAVIVPDADLSYAYDIVLEKAGIHRFVILFFQAWSAVMLKKLLMLCLALMLSVGHAFAAVDVNTADEAALDSVKGLGPVKSKAIVDERAKNGPFKDADDLANRVKGLGQKSVANLEQNGLTIGESSLPPTGKSTKPSATAPAKSTTTNPMSNSSGGSAAPNSTVKSSTAATGATSPAATTAQTPAATPASSTKASKKKSKASASDAASGTSTASDAKPTKSKRSKKDKAASAAAASQ